jgi:hypothetical protein
VEGDRGIHGYDVEWLRAYAAVKGLSVPEGAAKPALFDVVAEALSDTFGGAVDEYTRPRKRARTAEKELPPVAELLALSVAELDALLDATPLAALRSWPEDKHSGPQPRRKPEGVALVKHLLEAAGAGAAPPPGGGAAAEAGASMDTG